MPRYKNTQSTSLVQLFERTYKKGVRFYLLYSLNGQQTHEALKQIPITPKTDKNAYALAKAKAQAYQWARIEEIRNGKLGITATPDMLLTDWFNVCVEKVRKRERKEQTRHTWSRTIEYTGRILQDFAPNATMQDIDKKWVLSFIDWLQFGYTITRYGEKTRLKPNSADKKWRTFSFVMKEAVKEGIIGTNPCEQIDRQDKIKTENDTREYLTAEELQRLNKSTHIDEATKQVFFFMCFCGLRISDVKKLRWGDVRQEGGQVFLHITMQKTQKPLILPLSNIALHYLPKRENKTTNEPIFTLPHESYMNRRLKLWAYTAKVNKKVTLHVARHTFATLMLTEGSDLYTVSKLLGHGNVATTQIYAKIIDKKRNEAVQLLDNVKI